MVEIQFYSREEITKHNGKNGADIWLIIKDSVYNVTSYLSEHPGGGELLQEYAGKDATKPFNDFGHSSDTKNILKKFKIGELVEEDRKSTEKKTKAAKAKETEANKSQQTENNKEKDRSFLSYVTCRCLS